MLDNLRMQIINGLTESKKQSQLTTNDVYHAVRDAVTRSTQNLKAGERDVRRVASAAIHTSVKALVSGGDASRERIAAAVNGVIDGVSHAPRQLVVAAEADIRQAVARLEAERDALATSLRDSLDGASELAGEFSDEVRAEVMDALTDTKLHFTELLGLTRESVKQAVRQAIEGGVQIDETVRRITRDATTRAMREARFTAEQARNVSDAVLSAAVEAAEGSGSYIAETASAAAQGVREGLSTVIKQARESINKSHKVAVNYTSYELTQFRRDMQVIGDLFVGSLRKVADRSGNAARDMLHELALDAQKVGSSLREQAAWGAQAAAERLKSLGDDAVEAGGRAAHSAAEEAGIMGARMVSIAKGALDGMWGGTKKALNHGDKEGDRQP